VHISKVSFNKEKYPIENYANAQARDCVVIRVGCVQDYSQCT